MEDELKKEMEQQITIAGVLQRRLSALDSLRSQDMEAIAYRLAEVILAARHLYTKDLHELTSVPEGESKKTWDCLMGTRMQLLHLRDLVEEFELAFIAALR